jgi:hypothetical protein
MKCIVATLVHVSSTQLQHQNWIHTSTSTNLDYYHQIQEKMSRDKAMFHYVEDLA